MSMVHVAAGAGAGFLAGGPVGMVVGAVIGGFLGAPAAPSGVSPVPNAAQSAASSADLVNAIVANAPAPVTAGSSSATPALMQALIGTPAPAPSQVQFVDANGSPINPNPGIMPVKSPPSGFRTPDSLPAIVTSDPATAAAAAAGNVQSTALPVLRKPIAVRPQPILRGRGMPIESPPGTSIDGYGQYGDLSGGSMWLLTVGIGTIAWMMWKSHAESRA